MNTFIEGHPVVFFVASMLITGLLATSYAALSEDEAVLTLPLTHSLVSEPLNCAEYWR
jgi:hypothetical protein